MNIPEAIVSRVSFNKFGQLFLQFKVKKEDQTQEMKDHFMDLWESGNSLALATAPFQVEERESMPEEVKPREKTVYERLRWEVVKDTEEEFRDKAWMDFKVGSALSKNIDVSDGIGHAAEVWTEEEAEKLIAEFQGIPALEKAMTKNL